LLFGSNVARDEESLTAARPNKASVDVALVASRRAMMSSNNQTSSFGTSKDCVQSVLDGEVL